MLALSINDGGFTLEIRIIVQMSRLIEVWDKSIKLNEGLELLYTSINLSLLRFNLNTI